MGHLNLNCKLTIYGVMRSAVRDTGIGLAILVAVVCLLNTAAVEAQYWESPEEPGGGEIVAIHTDESGRILASSAYHGIFRSTDRGVNWTKATMSSSVGRVSVIVSDHEGTLYGGVDTGVVRSTDDGQTWTYLQSAVIEGSVASLAVTADGDLIAGCVGHATQRQGRGIDGGIYRSSDRGESWEYISEGLTGVDSHVGGVAADSSGFLFATVTYSGVFRSLDSGLTWSKSDSGLTTTAVFTVATNGQGDVFIGTVSSGMYRSTDNGDSWQHLAASPNRAASIVIMDDGTIVVGSTGDGLWYSGDNGDSWSRMGYDISSLKDLICFSIDATGRVAAGADNGVHVAESLESPWEMRNHGLLGITVRGFGCRGDEIFAGCYLGVLKSTDLGNSWEVSNPVGYRGLVNEIVVGSDGTLYMGTSNDGPWRSYDGGQVWELIDVGFNGIFVNGLFLAPNGYLFAGSASGLQRSTDGGDSWHDVNDVVDTWNIQDFAASDLGMLFVAADGRVYRSPDSGTQWYPADNGLDSIDVTVLYYVNGQYLFAGTADSGIYRSDDNGDTWSPASDGLELYEVKSITSNQLGHLLAGTEYGGVYLSTDYGDSWAPVNEGLLDDNVTALEVTPTGRFLVATEGGGMARSTSFGECCVGSRGNIDGDLNDVANVSDLTYLVTHLFSGGASPVCGEEGDVNGDGELNIQDLTYFVAYLFSAGPAPAACP